MQLQQVLEGNQKEQQSKLEQGGCCPRRRTLAEDDVALRKALRLVESDGCPPEGSAIGRTQRKSYEKTGLHQRAARVHSRLRRSIGLLLPQFHFRFSCKHKHQFANSTVRMKTRTPLPSDSLEPAAASHGSSALSVS